MSLVEIGTPLHVGVVHGQPVRFFAVRDGKAEQPWCCVDDVIRICDFDALTIGVVISRTREMLADRVRTMFSGGNRLTLGDPVFIPEFLAQLEFEGHMTVAQANGVCREIGLAAEAYIEQQYPVASAASIAFAEAMRTHTRTIPSLFTPASMPPGAMAANQSRRA